MEAAGMHIRAGAAALAAFLLMGSPGSGLAAAPEPLTVERRIPLGEVRGRIDHLAVDLARQRLFVAELGNDSLGVVDLAQGRLLKRIAGLEEPQGVAYLPATDLVYVASGGDGTLRRFEGGDLSPRGRTGLGEDADNVRVDPRAGEVVVGYGRGALALLDAASGRKAGEIGLRSHPESFQLEREGRRAFVNVPGAGEIAVVDRGAARQVGRWTVEGAQGNFPMALDEADARLLVAYREPALLVVLDTRSGAPVARLATCGDADDVFFDTRRQRAYVSCGEGLVDVVERHGDAYRSLAHVPTIAGARTALFVPELDRLFLAVRASGKEPAAVWVLRPSP
jgi:hypothetical protein